MTVSRRIFALALVAACVGTRPGEAVTRRVPSGYARITDALAAAAAGDTIRVAAGIYAPSTNGEAFPLNLNDDGLVLLGAGAANTVIDAEGQSAVLQWWPTTAGRISGLTVRGGLAYQGSGIHVIFGTPEIDHNVVIGNGAQHAGSGIMVNEGADPWIHHNVVWENYRVEGGTGDPHGIQVYRGFGTIEHNLVGRGDSNGIFIGAASTSIVRNNVIFENGTEGDRGRGICHFGTAATVIRNNLFYGNVIAAVLILTPQGGQNLNSTQVNDYSPTDEIDGNVDADPLLVDPDHRVWFLSSGSPAIDAGHAAPGPDPDGTPPDIGPFYFDQTPAAVPPGPRFPVALVPAFPNPSRAGVVLEHAQSERARVSLVVIDVQGRRVATLLDMEAGPGTVTATWDGRAAGGTLAPPGVYFAVLRAGGGTFARKLVRR